MDSSNEIKQAVRDKYASIAQQSKQDRCGCSSAEVACVGDDYTQIEGYVAEADLGLGCGIPTEIAQIKPGDTVLDLGSGAGNDVFIARAIVGATGKVIGVDMTEDMIEKARINAAKLGFTNVEFRLGEIEALPVDADSIDVVISNCVLNLVPDKRRAFSEIWRVLKFGGHFSISDIVVEGELPEKIRKLAEGYVGCVADAISKNDYLHTIKESGFLNVSVAKEKPIFVLDEFLEEHLNEKEKLELQANDRLVSITVYGEKPLGNK